MNLIFATQNKNKVLEISNLLPSNFDVRNLLDLGYTVELEESTNTLEGNALQKAQFVFYKYKTACFADDTGLEVTGLGGEPGVFSARYAGTEKSSDSNMDLLLQKLDGIEDRSAQFRTVIAYVDASGSKLFEGIIKGEITKIKCGNKGFGYDPIFKPESSQITFAEMPLDEKKIISHRGLALKKFISFLNTCK